MKKKKEQHKVVLTPISEDKLKLSPEETPIVDSVKADTAHWNGDWWWKRHNSETDLYYRIAREEIGVDVNEGWYWIEEYSLLVHITHPCWNIRWFYFYVDKSKLTLQKEVLKEEKGKI